MIIARHGGGQRRITALGDNLLAVCLGPCVALVVVGGVIVFAGGEMGQAGLFFMGLSLTTTIIGALLLISFIAEWRRMRRLQGQEVPAEIAELLNRARDFPGAPTTAPRWSWRPLDYSVGACVVGLATPTLVVSRGLVDALRIPRWRPYAVAILAHECGHIRNSDNLLVPLITANRGLTKFILSMSFVGAIVRATRTAADAAGDEKGLIVGGVLLAVAFGALVSSNLLLNLLLKRREYYADIIAINSLPRWFTYMRLLRSSRALPDSSHPLPAERILALLHGAPVTKVSKRLVLLSLAMPVALCITTQFLWGAVFLAAAVVIIREECRRGFRTGVPILGGPHVAAAAGPAMAVESA